MEEIKREEEYNPKNPEGWQEGKEEDWRSAVPKEEKLELLKREEIRTMQKDINRLREIEAQRERERVAALKTAGETREERGKSQITPPPAPPPSKEGEAAPITLIPKIPPPKPFPAKKILVRAVVVAILLLVGGCLYWFFGPEKAPVEEIAPLEEEEVIPPAEEVEEKPEIIIPPSLISVEETKVLEVSSREEIPAVFGQLLEEDLTEGSFTQVVIKNTSENQLTSLEDLSAVFQIAVPEGIFQKLEEDFTLFVYSQKQGKRIGVITKIKGQEGLSELLRSWEPELKDGLSVSGQEIPALVPYFKTASYQGAAFRYQSFSEQDFGICYSTFNDYFILTSSGESMLKVINQLTAEIHE